jgi:transposase
MLNDARRFKKSRQVGPYLELTPRQRQSSEHDPQLRITRAGDTALRSLLVQSAHYILGPFDKYCDLRRWGLARLDRGGPGHKKRVLVAVARKLAVLLHLLVSGQVYDPSFTLELPPWPDPR